MYDIVALTLREGETTIWLNNVNNNVAVLIGALVKVQDNGEQFVSIKDAWTRNNK